MSYQVKALGPNDLDDLVALERLCFAYHWTQGQFLMGLEKNTFRILGIRTNTCLAGYIAFSIIEDEMEILNIAVHPQKRQSGIGNLLLKRALEICQKFEIKKSFLEVKESNFAAISLYCKFGYVQYGIRKKYYPDTKEDALLFCYDFS